MTLVFEIHDEESLHSTSKHMLHAALSRVERSGDYAKAISILCFVVLEEELLAEIEDLYQIWLSWLWWLGAAVKFMISGASTNESRVAAVSIK
jgi:hypothetical protein